MGKRSEQRGDGGSLAVAEEEEAEGLDGWVGEELMEEEEQLPPALTGSELEALERATGSRDYDLATGLMTNVIRGLGIVKPREEEEEEDWDEEDRQEAQRQYEIAAANERARSLAAMAALRAIGPREGLEGMLAAQMVCVHGAAVEFTRRAMRDGQYMEARAIYMQQAGKLMTLFTRQIETLDRHRNRRAVNVGRVNVEAGGQAIVGTVHSKAGKNE